MNSRISDYGTNFLERLITVERDMEALKASQTAQTAKLDKLIDMGESANSERHAIASRLKRMEPTVEFMADGLMFAKTGRKIVAWGMAAAAFAFATAAGVLGSWTSIANFFWPPK